ncbi:DMT family transporter [Lancefieldella parvula]|uniref:DMT family transporter n=1 Tax=Lancefieldella parvula TaxID=1382 RepID=UPI0028802F48|nr:DMT family transporter [Lancefieldella parvula]
MTSSDLSTRNSSKLTLDTSSALVWKFALLVCALIWGGSFVVIKDAINYIPTAWLMTLRFTLSVIVVGIIFRKRLKENLDIRHLTFGALLGILNGFGFLFQNGALAYTTAGKTAFIASIYCAMIPFVNWLIAKKKPHISSIIAACMCVAGIGLISLGTDFSFSFGIGEQMALISAIIFAFVFILTAELSHKLDIITLTIIQLGVSTLPCLGWALCFETMPNFSQIPSTAWMALAYIIFIATALTGVLQNRSQKSVSPIQASLIISLDTIFAAIFGVIFLSEVITPTIFLGFIVIFVAIFISELGEKPAEPQTTSES